MFFWKLGSLVDDKLIHRREKTLGEAVSLEEAVSLLEASCFKDVKVVKCDFKDFDGLKGDPVAFLKKYFTPEDRGYQSTAEHSIFSSGSGNALHRLRLNYSVKGEEHEKNSSYSSFIWRNPYTSRCYIAFKDLRNAVIEFYDKG
jgi:hypothetical protein